MSDKTEQPTQRRLRRAREDGDSGASAYAAQAVAFLATVAIVPFAVRALVVRTTEDLRLAVDAASHRGGWDIVERGFSGTTFALSVVGLVLPVLVAAGLVGGVAFVLQTGGVLAASRLAPRLERLDPAAGVARLFSGARIFAVLRALVACLAVGALAYRELCDRVVDLARVTGRASWVGALVSGATERFAWRAAAVGLAIGIADLVVTRGAWLGRLKMTKAEVRREYKDAEGDPLVKAARERAYSELLAQATIGNVKGASVVVINPTHLACALRYDGARDGSAEGDDGVYGAPVVVASGEGDVAARIVQAAQSWGVPIVRDVPLARALRELEVGDAIPEALYEAVAEILRELWNAS